MILGLVVGLVVGVAGGWYLKGKFGDQVDNAAKDLGQKPQ